MRIGIVYASDHNPYVSMLIAKLSAMGHEPRCLLCVQRPLWRTVWHHLRRAGWRTTIRKILDRSGLMRHQDSVRRSLAASAERQGLTAWDRPVSSLNARYRIERIVLPRVNCQAMVEAIRVRKLDVVINTAGEIIKEPLLGAARVGILNAHMGPLPAFRGMNVLEWSLFYRQPVGVTLHLIDGGIDTGDVLLFKAIPVEPGDTVASLRAKSLVANVQAMAEGIERLDRGAATRTPQAPEQGKQYFVMHPRLVRVVNRRLARTDGAPRRLHVLAVTNLFPNAREPNRGVFNRQQLRELATSCSLRVVAPLPWVPRWVSGTRLARWSRFAGVPARETIDGIEVHHPRYLVIPKIGRFLDGLWFGLGVWPTVRRLSQAAPCDALLASWAYPDVYAAVRMGERLGVPVVAKLHGSDINTYARRGLRRRWVARALQRAERVVAVSSSLREEVVRLGVPEDRVALIRNGVDRTRFVPMDQRSCRAALGLPADERLILFIGHLPGLKGLNDLLEAFARLRRSGEAGAAVSLALIGNEAGAATVRERVVALQIQDAVRFVGARPHAEIPQWLNACDLLCLPSPSEGCPNVILEALACGRPVVASDTPGIAEVVHHGQTGILVPVGDPEALAAGLRRALGTAWDARRAQASAPRGWQESAQELGAALREAASSARSGLRVLHVLRYSVPNMSGYTHRSQSIIERQRGLGAQPAVITSARHESAHDPSTRAPASTPGPSLGMSPQTARGVVPSEVEGRRSGAPGLPGGLHVETINGITYYRSRPSRHALGRLLGRLPILGELVRLVRFRRDILRAATRQRAQLIHAHSPVLCGLPALWAARRLRLPCVYEVRALWEDAAVDQEKTTERGLRYVLSRACESHVLRRVDRVVVICDGLKREIVQRGIPGWKIAVMPNGVDTRRFVPRPRQQRVVERHALNDQRVVGFIGSFFAFEGLTTLLEAVPLLRARHPNVKVLIVGAGEEEPLLQRLVQERGLAQTVVLTGRVRHEDIADYYSIMDVLVYPRLSKRITELVTPLKPLEAMALGRTVIASDVGGLRELVRDGATGLLFKAGDARDLAEKCAIALEDPALSKRLAAAGRVFVERERDWMPVCRSYLSLYQDLVGAP